MTCFACKCSSQRVRLPGTAAFRSPLMTCLCMQVLIAARAPARYGCLPIAAGGPLAIRELAASYIASTDIDDSFYIMDLGNVQRLYDAWHVAMPRVTPFYAMKCSPMPALMTTDDH